LKRTLPVFIGLDGLIAVAMTTIAAASNDGAEHASAIIRDASGNVVGEAKLTEDATGIVHVNVHVKGLSAGEHGIHIHATGACNPTFAAAGGHHNPLGHQHGLDNPNGPHAGDLPALTVNGAGVGHLDAKTNGRPFRGRSPSSTRRQRHSHYANPDDQVTDRPGTADAHRLRCRSRLATKRQQR
jgi:Cu-Zn family superoxide dismutase